MITEDLRKCVDEQGIIIEVEIFRLGMEAKSKEFLEKAAEVYAKV